MSAVRPVLPQSVKQVIGLLEQAGFEAWCVGGCVRDPLMGRAPQDWDVTTCATPEEMKTCFASYRTVDTGIRHGTVTVIAEGEPIEVTTYRSDGEYLDHRHPETVTFSRNLRDDLSRRDFTVNAMAYHPGRGLVDLFGGEKDLEKRLLRCVGDPERRFEEDALRILRCLRFAATLGGGDTPSFTIEPNTAGALFAGKDLLQAIARERVREELDRLLCGSCAGDVLRTYSEIIFTVLPELSPMKGCLQETPYHCFDVWEHTLHALETVPARPVLRWAALLHDCGKPAAKQYDEAGVAHFYGHVGESERIAEAVLGSLRFSNADTEAILTLVKLHGELHPIPEKRMKKLLARYGQETVSELLSLSLADLSAQPPALFPERAEKIRESGALLEKLLLEQPCLSLRDLAVRGRDLMALGFSPGKALGNTLDLLLEKVLSGELPNERAALLEEAGKHLERKA